MKNELHGKDVVHNVAVKFSQAFLPEAKKPYNLRTAHQKELSIQDIARAASKYNIGISPEVIEQGLNVGIKLMFMLTADGYKIKTPLFTIKLKVPGEYDGTETCLPAGVFPVVHLQPSVEINNYIQETVHVDFDGKIENEGFIACATDEATGLSDETATRGHFLTLHGVGLKISADEDKKEQAGMFFIPESGVPIKVELVAVNEPRTLKIVVPNTLIAGEKYRLAVETQCSARTGAHLLKKMRDIRSDFTVTAQ